MNFKRILLKISGEALSGDKGFGFDYDFLGKVVSQLITLSNQGIQVGVVVGGGNFWRGRQGNEMDRTVADQMGMLATVINALALKDAIKNQGGKATVYSSIAIEKVCDTFVKDKAIQSLQEGNVVIFAGGTGSPYFSTDTAASLRASEIGADMMLLAKNVDGIYDSDPKINKNAKKYDEISYLDFIKNQLKAMDTTAVTMCMENNLPVLCFALTETSIIEAVSGKKLGTWIR